MEAARPASRSLRDPRRFTRGLNSGVLAGGAIVAVFVLTAGAAPWLTGFGPDDASLLLRLRPPGGEHLLGTDQLGRDLATRLFFGARVSLIVSLGAVGLAMLIGVPLGIVAGYSRGGIDALIMRAMDVLLSIPKILLAILIMAVVGPGVGNLIWAIAIWNVPVFARITRSSTLSLREREFILAAEATGNSRPRVMFRHILPNTTGEIIVTATLAIATAIMAESGLSFLGLGVPPHVASWGLIISEGRPYLRTAPHVTTLAGLFIMVAILGFNVLGDGLRDANDPRRRSRDRVRVGRR